MVEQKPEVKIDPEGYSDRGAGVLGQTNRKLGRLGNFLRKHPTAQKIAAVGAFVGLGGIAVAEVAGCGPGKTENTTNPPGISSTQVPSSTSQTNKETTTSGKNTSKTEKQSSTTEIPESKLVSISEVSRENLPEELSKILEIRLGDKVNDIDKIQNIKAKSNELDQEISFFLISVKENSYIATNIKDWGYRVKDYIVSKNIFSGSKETHILYRDYDETAPFFDFKLGGDFKAKSGEDGVAYLARIGTLLNSSDIATIISKNVTGLTIKDTSGNKKIEYGINNKPEIDAIISSVNVGEDYKSNVGKSISDRERPYKSNGEIRIDYLDGLTSTQRTIEDVKKGAILKGEQITEPINVPQELQSEFKKNNPEDKIIYVGPANNQDDPEKMRDVLT
ncbi:MAG: hypothetical protein COX78_01235, partial [Candidatus Levybacteria bacterium CG_4_10_14_0_2_um_filter_35_8]